MPLTYRDERQFDLIRTNEIADLDEGDFEFLINMVEILHGEAINLENKVDTLETTIAELEAEIAEAS
jgi:hypothetical protein